MKRIIIALLAIVSLVTAVFAVNSLAAEKGTSTTYGELDGTDIFWNYDSEAKKLTISLAEGAEPAAMPETFSSYLGQDWGSLRTKIESVEVSAGITHLSGHAFSRFEKLKSITIHGNDLKTIGAEAFNRCLELTSLALPSSVEKLAITTNSKGGKVFYRCENLTLLELPSGIVCSAGSSDSNTGNFANVKARIVFFSNDSDTVVITNSIITCLANASTLYNKPVSNTISFRTPAGQIDLDPGFNPLDSNIDEDTVSNLFSTKIEAATTDVTVNFVMNKSENVYTYTSEINTSSNVNINGAVATYYLNFEKGLDASNFNLNGATLNSYSADTGIITCTGKLGAPITVELEKPTFLGAIPNINEDINLYFTTKIPSFYENPKMTFNFRGNETVVSEVVEKNGKPAFKFSDIRPEFMGETVSATLSAEFNGEIYSSTYSTSLKDYFAWVLSAFDGNSNYEKLTGLVKSMIAYGMAAENYSAIKPESSISSLFDEAYASDAVPEKSEPVFSGTASDAVKFTGVGLRYDTAMAVYYTFIAEDTVGLTLTVSIGGRETVYNVSELSAISGTYRVDFEGIMATEFGDTITATFKKDGNEIGRSVKYNVNTYVYYAVNLSNSSEELIALVKAIYAYGVAAESYAK